MNRMPSAGRTPATDRTSEQDDTRESNQSLWMLVISPAIWSIHFLACYITAAVWCAKFAGPRGSLTGVRIAIAGYTILALVGIAAIGWWGYCRHRNGPATVPHDFDTPEDRQRFIGFATLLLSALSAVATLFVAMVAVYVERCD